MLGLGVRDGFAGPLLMPYERCGGERRAFDRASELCRALGDGAARGLRDCRAGGMLFDDLYVCVCVCVCVCACVEKGVR